MCVYVIYIYHGKKELVTHLYCIATTFGTLRLLVRTVTPRSCSPFREEMTSTHFNCTLIFTERSNMIGIHTCHSTKLQKAPLLATLLLIKVNE